MNTHAEALRILDAARQLDVEPGEVLRQIHEGTIAAYFAHDRTLRITADDVERFRRTST